MRVFTAFIIGLFVFGAAGFVYAADEFGARFNADAPVALETEEDRLQNIEPAAGDATDETTPGDAAPSNELEEKFGTEVTTTTRDSGDGQTEQHDSVGEGKIRAFYKSEQDGRVMDNSDAAGVEVEVLEFQ